MDKVYLLSLSGDGWTYRIQLFPEQRIEVQGDPTWQQVFFTLVLSQKLANRKLTRKVVEKAVREAVEYMGSKVEENDPDIKSIVDKVLVSAQDAKK
ncbi:MAG: hypothetical protein MZV70_29245 [Desulfobacterales bacterium]|nr:hypothetical protein [Desulfobacterales bacterium]